MMVTFRADEAVLNKLAEMEQATGLKRSEVIRQAILKGKVSTKHIPREIAYELNRIGNNINQLAKQANKARAVDIAVLEELTIIEGQLQELLEKCR
jgi:antitoxin component of RelBE/YafQ-DinJ toxin-antitoxin module